MHVLESQVQGCEDSTVETEPRVHLPISLAFLEGSRLVKDPILKKQGASPEEHHLWMSPASACAHTCIHALHTERLLASPSCKGFLVCFSWETQLP